MPVKRPLVCPASHVLRAVLYCAARDNTRFCRVSFVVCLYIFLKICTHFINVFIVVAVVCLFVCLSHMCALPSWGAPKSMQSKGKKSGARQTCDCVCVCVRAHVCLCVCVFVCGRVRNVGNVNGIVLLAQLVCECGKGIMTSCRDSHTLRPPTHTHTHDCVWYAHSCIGSHKVMTSPSTSTALRCVSYLQCGKHARNSSTPNSGLTQQQQQ